MPKIKRHGANMLCKGGTYEEIEVEMKEIWNERGTGRKIETDHFTNKHSHTYKHGLALHTTVILRNNCHEHSLTQTLSHTEAFDTQKLLNTEAFTLRSFYTQKLLHTEVFTHRSFCTQKRLLTQKLLQTETSTHRPFYNLLHTDPFRIFWT